MGSSLALLTASACGNDAIAPSRTPRVIAVLPSGGSIGVDPAAPIVVTFSHPMRPGMEQYAALHEGDVAGPTVPGAWTWSADYTTLTFTPAQPLSSQTGYTLHLGGGMRTTGGGYVDYGSCVGRHGGQWATSQMMGGGMMGGGNMMGSGWRHSNGSYGMVFTFTTD